jgi:hypothetical protein
MTRLRLPPLSRNALVIEPLQPAGAGRALEELDDAERARAADEHGQDHQPGVMLGGNAQRDVDHSAQIPDRA